MSIFDELDRQASEAVAQVLNERVVWRPMVTTESGIYTGGDREPDPDRPVVGEDENFPLQAIVTFKVSSLAVGSGSETPSGIVVADCVVDFDSEVFRAPDGSWSFPVKGDIFELLEEAPPNNLVQVDQRGDDGAARILFHCSHYE
jgi:hypothetical protein